jgi:cyanophycinase
MKNFLFLLLFAINAIACQPKTDLSPYQEEELSTESKKGGGSTNLTSYFTGSPLNIETTTTGGTVLMGGGRDVDAAMRWMISKSGGGDFVVLRASGADGYNEYIYSELGGVNSVETLIIDSKAKADLADVEEKIRNAEAVFIAGGDQANYVSYWKGTRVQAALNYLAQTKKVPIGGTSAGLAILGAYYYGASNGSATSTEALSNPYHRNLNGIDHNFLQMPYLQNVITDSHYGERSRQGRHFVFQARLVKDFGVPYSEVRGIGVDERTAACIDENGTATVYGEGNVYFTRGQGGTPEICANRTPITWYRNARAIRACVVAGTSNGTHTFNLSTWTSTHGQWQYWFAQSGTFSMVVE